jgi:hypothetical protein
VYEENRGGGGYHRADSEANNAAAGKGPPLRRGVSPGPGEERPGRTHQHERAPEGGLQRRAAAEHLASTAVKQWSISCQTVVTQLSNHCQIVVKQLSNSGQTVVQQWSNSFKQRCLSAVPQPRSCQQRSKRSNSGQKVVKQRSNGGQTAVKRWSNSSDPAAVLKQWSNCSDPAAVLKQ